MIGLRTWLAVLVTILGLPLAPAACAAMIGINFKSTDSWSKVEDRIAGLKPQINWKDVGYWTSSDFCDDTGTSTAISVAPNNCGYTTNTYVTVPADNGNNYLMRGHLYQTDEPMTVTVTGLGTDFTTDGYDVIVYFDGDNGTDWTTDYTIVGADVATISGKDLANANFSGTFDDATTDGLGNYVRFTGLTSSEFTLTATPQTGDGPINGIQIVAAPEPTALALLSFGLAATLARRRQTRLG